MNESRAICDSATPSKWLHVWHMTHMCAHTTNRFPCESATPQESEAHAGILKSLLATHFTAQNDCSPDFVKIICQTPKIYEKDSLARTLKIRWFAEMEVSVRNKDAWLEAEVCRHAATRCSTLQHTATYCNTLQHTATHCNTLQHTATHCNTLQHTATHCNTLQHIATHVRCIEV